MKRIFFILLTNPYFYKLVYETADYLVKKRKAKKGKIIDIDKEKQDVIEAFNNTLIKFK